MYNEKKDVEQSIDKEKLKQILYKLLSISGRDCDFESKDSIRWQIGDI